MITVLVNSRGISEYLDRKVPDRVLLRKAIDEIRSKLSNTVIFGGMIRDFALGRARIFSSDIDLVSEASDVEILDAIKSFSPERNKFGGFRFRSGKWRFDIWSLSQTWAFKEGYVVGEHLDDLLATTFFNVDAAIFNLNSRVTKASLQFSAGIDRRMLDVNLEENPFPDRVARRAIRMAMECDLAISARLVQYIVSRMSYCPPWIGEVLWQRLLEHNLVSDRPFHIDAQQKIPISDSADNS